MLSTLLCLKCNISHPLTQEFCSSCGCPLVIEIIGSSPRNPGHDEELPKIAHRV